MDYLGLKILGGVTFLVGLMIVDYFFFIVSWKFICRFFLEMGEFSNGMIGDLGV